MRVIGAYRDTEVDAPDALSALLADLAHAGLAIHRRLVPLGADAAARLLAVLLPGADADRRHIGAVLDAAHCALNGEAPQLALDIVWSHLCLINLKNAYWRRTNGPEATVAEYQAYWTSMQTGTPRSPLMVLSTYLMRPTTRLRAMLSVACCQARS